MAQPSNYPYPTSHAIYDMFSDPNSRHDTVIGLIADHADSKIMGYEHHYAGEFKTKDSFLKTFKDDYSGMMNDDTINYEVVNVIGGGDVPWAAVEGKATAKSKTGKKLVHEHVYILRFDGTGKITKIRAYFDTHHIHNHAKDAGKTSA
ncbi:hypothetical protein BDR22DRAFT_825263 [Usnea florida]